MIHYSQNLCISLLTITPHSDLCFKSSDLLSSDSFSLESSTTSATLSSLPKHSCWRYNSCNCLGLAVWCGMHMNACMQLHMLPCSYISLHAGPWAFFVWAAHKNFAVLVTLQRLPKAAKTSIVSSKLGCLILIFYLDAIASVGLPTTH